MCFFIPASGKVSSRKRVQSQDLVSYADGASKTGSLKRHSYDCAVHLDEIPLSNNNEVGESANESLSDTDSENEETWSKVVPSKNYLKETYI